MPEPVDYVPPVAPPVPIPALPTVLAPYDDSIDAEGDTDEEDFSDLCITTPYYVYAPVNAATSASSSSDGCIIENAPVASSAGQQPVLDSAVQDTISTEPLHLVSTSTDGTAIAIDHVNSTARLTFTFDFDCIDPALLSTAPPSDAIVDSIEIESHTIDGTSVAASVNNKTRKRKSPSLEPVASKRQRFDDQEEHCHGDSSSSEASPADSNKTEISVIDSTEPKISVAAESRKRKSSSHETTATKRQRISASPTDDLTASLSPTIATVDTARVQTATDVSAASHTRSESPSSTFLQDTPRRCTRSQPPVGTPVRRSKRTRKTPRRTGQ